MPHGGNEYLVQYQVEHVARGVCTGTPVGPVLKGVVAAPRGPANGFKQWWKGSERVVRRYVTDARVFLRGWLLALTSVPRDRCEYLSEHGLNLALQRIRRFETMNRQVAQVLAASIDELTSEEEAALAYAIELRRVALRSFALIQQARRRLEASLEARYVFLELDEEHPLNAAVWPVVDDLIREVEALLRETASVA